jgi:enoyl-CoA hydratase
VLSTALAWAGELARGALVAQGVAKRLIDEGLQGELPAGLEAEQEAFAQVFQTEDSRIGVRSFLSQGPGKAIFTGR